MRVIRVKVRLLDETVELVERNGVIEARELFAELRKEARIDRICRNEGAMSPLDSVGEIIELSEYKKIA